MDVILKMNFDLLQRMHFMQLLNCNPKHLQTHRLILCLEKKIVARRITVGENIFGQHNLYRGMMDDGRDDDDDGRTYVSCVLTLVSSVYKCM